MNGRVMVSVLQQRQWMKMHSSLKVATQVDRAVKKDTCFIEQVIEYKACARSLWNCIWTILCWKELPKIDTKHWNNSVGPAASLKKRNSL